MDTKDKEIIKKHFPKIYDKEISSEDKAQYRKEFSILRFNYYNRDDYKISDKGYDTLEALLESKGIYINAVGAPVPKGEKKVKHISPMLSLNKVNDTDGLLKWISKIKDKFKTRPMIITASPKIDGVALELVYKGGCLMQAVTRGDGIEGVDVTKKAIRIKNVDWLVDGRGYKIGHNHSEIVVIRGEVTICQSEEYYISGYNTAKRLIPVNNSRKLVVGALNGDCIKTVSDRELRFFAYGYDEFCCFERMKNSRCNCVFKQRLINGNVDQYGRIYGIPGIKPLWKWEKGNYSYKQIWREVAEEIKDLCVNKKAATEHIGAETDGLVFKFDNSEIKGGLGSSKKAPNWAIAYKWQDEHFTTRIIDINFQISDKGKITPVAKLEPIKINGTIVKRVNLHNSSFIEKKDIGVGSTVTIILSGGVIPKVLCEYLGTYHSPVGKKHECLRRLEYCPSCNGDLEDFRKDDICLNKDCFGKTVRSRQSGWVEYSL